MYSQKFPLFCCITIWVSPSPRRSRGGGAASFAPEQDASLPPENALAYNSILTKAPPKPQDFDQRWSSWGSAFGGSAKLQWQPWFTTDRTSALGDQMQAKFQGQSVGGRLEAGYRFGLPAANECRCRGFCWQP